MDNTPSKAIVVVMAHPDDAEILCFGTMLKYQKAGHRVHLIIVCSGEHGVSVAERNKRDSDRISASARFHESARAFSRTEVEIESLHFEDSNIRVDNSFVTALEQRLVSLKAEIIITHFVDLSGADHQDHSTVARVCSNVAVRCSSLRLFLQAEPMQQIRSGFVANYFVDITEHFGEKVAALQEHESQRGRSYLTEEYHLVKCRNNALGAGASHYERGRLFEAFYASYWLNI